MLIFSCNVEYHHGNVNLCNALFQTEKYYLRSLGEGDPRKTKADIRKDFPELSADVIIPPFFDEDKFFSSVFRISSKGIQLWTHYDVSSIYAIINKNLFTLYKCMVIS